MKTALIIAAVIAILAAAEDIDPLRGATTDAGEACVVTMDLTDQVTLIAPELSWEEASEPSPLPLDIPDEYFKIDSLFGRIFVTPGDEYVVSFDYQTASLADSIVPYQLSDLAEQALDVSPDWLRDDLEWSFHLLSPANQDRYATLILNVSDPRALDEVIFQVAHLSWTVLADPNWDETLIEENATWIYTIDDDLQYVEVKDYSGSGFYSTTEYRFLSSTADTTLVEVPRDIYYWYIVMPRVSDEKPLQDASVYDMFWREYLYTQSDVGYPILSESMTSATVLWDGEPCQLYNNNDSTQAVHRLTWWEYNTVVEAAWGNRPIQPNVIAFEHNGNCGENQDLLCAAARTVLIPTICTMDILEDHVWCEVWWDDQWHPWQPDWVGNPYIAYDVDFGGSKENSCIWDWRNDGYTWDAIGTYSQVCTLSVTITDSLDVPVDNARVSIGSEQYYSTTVGRGTWGVTDQMGQIGFILGNNQNYYVSVSSPLGNYPSGGWGELITNSVAGEHYYWSWKPPLPMPTLDVTEGEPGVMSKYLLEVEYELPCDVQFDRDFYSNPRNEYAYPLEDGVLPFFIVNWDNLEAYSAGEPFEAFEVADEASTGHVYFYLANSEDFFIVLSGKEHTGFSTLADLTVRLWEHDGTGVHGVDPVAPSMEVAPNPFTGHLSLSFRTPAAGPASLTVYDISGRVVSTFDWELLESGESDISWEAVDDSGAPLASGAYFVRLEAPGLDQVRRVTLVR